MDNNYGMTGFVKLSGNEAEKHSEFYHMYWLNEYIILTSLWPYQTDNIIQYKKCKFDYAVNPLTKEVTFYQRTTFKKYKHILSRTKIHRDEDVLQILLDLASALKFLHSLNIYHRDVKPDNIAIDNNRAVLFDFSHSHRQETQLTRLDPNVVTFYYRAPEIFDYQQTYTESIDIYALGMTLIEIITGRSFADFYTQNIEDLDQCEIEYANLLKKPRDSYHKIKDYYHAYKRNFSYADEYWKWITKMIANNPTDRITAEDLYDDILDFAIDKMDIVVPVNGGVAADAKLAKKIYKDITTVKQYELYNTCINKAKDIKEKNHMTLEISNILQSIRFLISVQYITDANYHVSLTTLMIVIETIVYDNIFMLEEGADDYLVQPIMTLIADYSGHLFTNTRCVTFDTVIEEVGKK